MPTTVGPSPLACAVSAAWRPGEFLSMPARGRCGDGGPSTFGARSFSCCCVMRTAGRLAAGAFSPRPAIAVAERMHGLFDLLRRGTGYPQLRYHAKMVITF